MKMNRILYLIGILAMLLLWLRGVNSAGMALLFLLFYGAAALISVRVSGRELAAVIHSGGISEKNEPMEIGIRIENRGRLPVLCGSCEIVVINRLTGETRRRQVPVSLHPGGSRTEEIEVMDRCCGKLVTSLQNLVITDPLDLFASQRQIPAEAAAYIAPQILPVEISDNYLDSYNMESYQYSQYEKGNDPGEVFGVREYQEGDSLKQIHWKLTAKLGTMTVKIPSFPIENNILVILDNLMIPEVSEAETLLPARRSALVELFFSISAALLEKSIPHSIGWYDTQEELFRLQRISSRTQMQQVMPEVLGCGFEESELSTIYRYLETQEGAGFTNHFLVTGQEERDVERLESYGAVKVFRETE